MRKADRDSMLDVFQHPHSSVTLQVNRYVIEARVRKTNEVTGTGNDGFLNFNGSCFLEMCCTERSEISVFAQSVDRCHVFWEKRNFQQGRNRI